MPPPDRSRSDARAGDRRPREPEEPEQPRWLTISEACALLGVDQSTLRRWTDEGRVPVFLTPGGHRRYVEHELRELMAREGGKPSRGRVGRRELTSRTLSAYEEEYLQEARRRRWYQAFGAEVQEEHRQMGRRLVDIAIRYASASASQSERRRLLSEGREIGRYYGRSGAAAGLTIAETIEAFLYFRYPTVRAVLSVIEEESLPTRRAARLFVAIDDFIDQVLLEMTHAYETTEA